MGLNRFEQKLEGFVSGAFARAFRSEVEPVEISAALKREVDNGARILSRDRRLVPNRFIVTLSQSDYERLTGFGQTLIDELTADVRDHGNLQRYTFSGPIDISLAPGERTPTGKFTVAARTGAPIPRGRDPQSSDGQTRMEQSPQQPPQPSRQLQDSSQLILTVNGTPRRLEPPSMVIGRGSDADVRIDDAGVSRRHAEIRLQPDPHTDELRASILDLGSTNGTLVNHLRIASEISLTDGDEITIGNTTLRLARSQGQLRQPPQHPQQQQPPQNQQNQQNQYGPGPGPRQAPPGQGPQRPDERRGRW